MQSEARTNHDDVRRLPQSLLDEVPDPWSIGIYTGESPFSFSPAPGIQNPVLTRDHVSDVLASFVADPFIIQTSGLWYMFFEVMNWQARKGQIGFATSEDALHWTYRHIVLDEPFHLSYPCVFEWEREFYMIPETHQANAARLYRAACFPTDWRYVKTLVTGPCSDSSIIRHDDRWWLFTCKAPSSHDNLHLYLADNLESDWSEHPMSPLISGDARTARPAGRILAAGGTVIRYAQDCYPRYGSRVRAFEAQELTASRYAEIEHEKSPVLAATGIGWNGRGMHHIDPHPIDGRWLACVDGHRAPD